MNGVTVFLSVSTNAREFNFQTGPFFLHHLYRAYQWETVSSVKGEAWQGRFAFGAWAYDGSQLDTGGRAEPSLDFATPRTAAAIRCGTIGTDDVG